MSGEVCRNEFRPSNFLLGHPDPRLFVTSQWRFPGIMYVLYRVLAATYFLVWIVLSGALRSENQKVKWFIYLTNWSFFMLTICLILQAVTAVHAFWTARSPTNGSVREPEGMPWYLKVQWVLYNISSNAALCVTVAYWGLLYSVGDSVSAVNASTHGVNSVYVVMDLFITATPIRVLHAYHSSLYGLIYIAFSVVYVYAGGTDPSGNHYVYPILNFIDNPGMAAATTVVAMLIGAPILWVFIFGGYQLRLAMANRCWSRKVQTFQVTPFVKKGESEGGVVNPSFGPTIDIGDTE